MPGLELRDVSRIYARKGAAPVLALNQVNLRIEEGEFVAIVGPSGGGKSTLLNILGLLDVPSSGEFLIEGTPAPLGATKRAAYRSKLFGFVFQSFHLLERRPARDSAQLGLLYQGVPAPLRKSLAAAALKSVDLLDRAGERAATLSGGQQQRVAIARAVATRPPIFLADEPTGNLDSASARRVLAEFERLNCEGATVIVVTHSDDVAAAAHRQIRVVDGSIVSTIDRLPESRAIASASATRPDPAIPANGGSRVRLRLTDMLHDAWASVTSRAAQSIALSLAVALAVALSLTTLGISETARAQVSETFDAQLNREVTATWDASLDHSSPPSQVASDVGRIAGVDSSMTIVDLMPATIATFAESRTVQPHVVFGDYRAAGAITVQFPTWRKDGGLKSDEILIGEVLAEQLGIGPIVGSPVVLLADQSYRVAGIITESRRLPLLEGEVLLSSDSATAVKPTGTISALLLTQTSAAQQVARQVPYAINPHVPEQIRVSAPTDPTQLRTDIEAGVAATLTAFTVLAVLIAIATLTNATTSAINARRGEIGMRKAVGGDNRHITALIWLETIYMGALGGGVGYVLGTVAILVITITQRWSPVLDLRLAPLAIVGGVMIGLLGGTFAAHRATRVHPAEALRL